MPVVNPIWLASIRKHWPLVGATVTFAVFMVIHLAFFQPTADRYQTAIKQAQSLGLAVNLDEAPVVVPPRVFSLLADNAMQPGTLKERSDSGALTAALLEDFTRMASANGLEVALTEPGPITQQPGSAQVRARLRLTGRYEQFMEFLAAIDRQGRLYAVDRFALQPIEGGRQAIDLWVSQYILKQAGRS